jgi:hypothetical protein
VLPGARRGGRRRLLAHESIEALFNALEPRVETRLRELRFLLALLLMRKRRLKVVRIVKKDDGEAFAVRRPRRDEELTVYVFELTPERQAELREELVRLFDQPDLSSLDAPPEDDELDDDGLEPESDETGSDGTGGESLAYDPKEDEAEETCAPRATDDER